MSIIWNGAGPRKGVLLPEYNKALVTFTDQQIKRCWSVMSMERTVVLMNNWEYESPYRFSYADLTREGVRRGLLGVGCEPWQSMLGGKGMSEP